MLKSQKKLIFFDAAQFPKATFTDEGFLRADAIITKPGVYQYKLADGRVINQFRPPQEVFSDATMDSMKLVPVTNGHPPTRSRLIDSKTAKTFSVGHVGERIVNDSNMYMRGNMVITDSKTIDDIKSGNKKQLSAGYTADLVEENGYYNGQAYTHVQRNIRMNHLAVVSEGRMGADAAIVLDGIDAIQILNINDEEDANMSNLKIVVLDGIEYQASPEVANALEKTSKEVENLKAEISGSKAILDEVNAKVDALQKANDEFAKRDINAEIATATNKRFSLLNTVKGVFGDDIYSKVQTFNDHDIKCDVLQPLYQDKDLKKQSIEYIDALFDATIEAKKVAKMSSQRSSMALLDGKKEQAQDHEELSPFQKRLGGNK